MSCAVILFLVAAVVLAGIALIVFLTLTAVNAEAPHRREKALEALRILLPQEVRLWLLHVSRSSPDGRRPHDAAPHEPTDSPRR